jgi:hypothetical protein
MLSSLDVTLLASAFSSFSLPAVLPAVWNRYSTSDKIKFDN